MATIGFSVGLGNFWKFPYVAGENGGGAFVLLYVLGAALIAVPVVMAELLLGRQGGGTPVTAMTRLAHGAAASASWRGLGWLSLLTAFVLMSYYAVIGGWTMDYALLSARGRLRGMTAPESQALYSSLLSNPVRMIVSQTAFLFITLLIIARGVKAGIERAATVLMPLLFGLLLVLMAYALYAGDAERGLKFLFVPDFSAVSGRTLLVAIGQAFFSIGVGMAAMMTYGAYLSPNERIPGSAAVIAGADTLVAVLAGIAIFPLVFAYGLEPTQGPGLVFVTLPVAFGQMLGGPIFGFLFFVLLFIAALTSAIAICEPAVAFAQERGLSRAKAAAGYGVLLWAAGLVSVLSFNAWSDIHPLAFISKFATASLFDLLDFLASNILLTTGGLLIALFAGWILPRDRTAAELHWEPRRPLFRAWLVLVRFVAPLAILLVLLFGVTG